MQLHVQYNKCKLTGWATRNTQCNGPSDVWLMFYSFQRQSVYTLSIKAQRRGRNNKPQPADSCGSAGKAFKGRANYEDAKSAKERFGCFVCWPTLRNYLFTDISTWWLNRSAALQDKERACMTIEATLKGEVLNTKPRGTFVTSRPWARSYRLSWGSET